MFKVHRKNILILSLVIVLCFISYLNYAINKYSLLETSTDFEKYEENKLAEISMDDIQDVDGIDESAIIEDNKDIDKNVEDIAVVDSTQSVIDNLVVETSSNIRNSIVNNKNIKRSNYFIEARLNTNMEREKMVALLNEIINNEKTDENNRKAANDKKMKLIDIMNKERIIENLIKAKGFEEALVFITDNSVNVIVEAEKLTDSDVAKILDIVMRETKLPATDIKIQNKF